MNVLIIAARNPVGTLTEITLQVFCSSPMSNLGIVFPFKAATFHFKQDIATILPKLAR